MPSSSVLRLPAIATQPRDPLAESYQHLQLSPEQWDFTLIHATIDHAPPYETLSYVCGPNLLNRSLAVSSGAVLRISENLERGLNCVVCHCLTGYLWIDQICINQTDTAERNRQVKDHGLDLSVLLSGACLVGVR